MTKDESFETSEHFQLIFWRKKRLHFWNQLFSDFFVNGSGPSKATRKEMDRIDHLFNQYANTSSNLIE